MNFRRIVGTLIVLLATIVGRWIAREPTSARRSRASTEPAVTPVESPGPDVPSPVEPSFPLVLVAVPASTRLVPESIATEPVAVAADPAPLALAEPSSIAISEAVAAESQPTARESNVALLEPIAMPRLATFEPDVAAEPTRAQATDRRTETLVATAAVPRTLESLDDAAVAAGASQTTTATLARPRAWSRDWPIAVPADGARHADDATAVDASADVVTIAPAEIGEELGTRESGVADERAEATPRATDPVAFEAVEPADEPNAAPRELGPPAPLPSPIRTRRRSETLERPNRLLGGAGFLLVAIACFVASFVLFVRLTTPDRTPATAYAVVPYVAATDRNVPPALASFAGLDEGDTWLVVRLPVAARYVAVTGLRTIDRWNSQEFTLASMKATYASNAGSCYSGAGVAGGPAELTPLAAGLVVRERAVSPLGPEHLVRVDVGGLLADATGTKTLVCAVVSPARTGFATYAATVGDPNVAAYEATAARVKLAVLPLAVDFSTFGNAAALRFTQTSLAVATDPLHATLDVAGFATFTYDDADGDARRDVLLFITGALATLGAVATVDALRPWLNIERR